MNPADSTGAAPLTPSETVLLYADQFAPVKAAMTGEDLLLREGKVASDQLSKALLAAALLANERLGSVRLEIKIKSSLFGLLKRRRLVAAPLPATSTWPEGTLEASVHSHLGAGERTVRDLVYRMLEGDSAVPGLLAPGLVKRGLGARGLLESKATKVLKVFTASTWVPAPGLDSLAAAQNSDEARELLRACETERPEVWEMLNKDIAAAIGNRTESSDHGFPDSD
jgi:hypothetical protein